MILNPYFIPSRGRADPHDSKMVAAIIGSVGPLAALRLWARLTRSGDRADPHDSRPRAAIMESVVLVPFLGVFGPPLRPSWAFLGLLCSSLEVPLNSRTC